MPNRKKKFAKKKKNKIHCKCHPLRRRLKRCCNSVRNPKKATVRKNVKTVHKQRQNKNKMSTNSGVCDKGGVKRIYSPFNKFYIRPQNQIPKRAFSDGPGKICLTPKEKSYIMCSCQTRSTRYAKLKNLAAAAMKNGKIFLIYGCCDSLRDALVERGWVEKIPANRMDLAKLRSKNYADNDEMHSQLERLLLSNFVEKCEPNFIWNARDDFSEKLPAKHNIIYNRLRVDAQWTTKQGLCESAKNHYWYYIENVAEVNTPRTYTTFDDGERQDFEADYKLTACTSLLKWVLSMVANDRPVFVESGKIALNVLVFALNRCKEYLFHKQNKDIDTICTKEVTSGQWNSFFKKYYIIIGKQDTFKSDKGNKLSLYLGYAKFLLKEIHKYRPQLSCEGCHNIWIIKPAHCSRGRGIRMASKYGVLSDLLNKGKYVFQKYIEEPLLVHGTKFDIRQYYLITSTGPLVIWMYKDCYLKFSSQKYSLKNYHESIHLTNNAVQKRYKNCVDRHPELPEHNMWQLQTYKEYLNKIGKEEIWDTFIYPGMKRSIIGTMLSCQESIAYSKNRFELYGCDFILDKDYKPWLIEINSCPDLNPTTPVTATICPAVLADIIKVVIDLPSNPRASTGKFECIYRQVISGPRYSTFNDFTVRGYTVPPDYFYRGNVQYVKKNNYDKNLQDHDDINTMLNKMKRLYEEDTVMVEPEGSNVEIVHEKVNSSDENIIADLIPDNIFGNVNTDTLNFDAPIITEQLDDLLIQLGSDGPCSVKTNFKPVDSSVSSPSSINLRKEFLHGKSLTQVKSFVEESVRPIITQNTFQFSRLDDGPQGKASGLMCLNGNVKDTFETENDLMMNKKQSDESGNNILEATKKLLNFLDEKAKEYTSS